jgi:hypothetical protein
MLDWIGDHWFELVAIIILGIGFLQLISLMQNACRSLEAISDQIKGLRADVAQAAEPATSNED